MKYSKKLLFLANYHWMAQFSMAEPTFFDLDDFRYLFYDQKNASKIYPSLSNHFRDSFLNLNKYINFVALPAIVKQYCFLLFVLTFLFSLF